MVSGWAVNWGKWRGLGFALFFLLKIGGVRLGTDCKSARYGVGLDLAWQDARASGGVF